MPSRDTHDLLNYLDSGITVADLKAELDNYPDEAKVLFSYNWGDYWRTEVACRVASIGEKQVSWSARLELPQLVDEEDIDGNDEGDTDESLPIVVVLNSTRY